MTMEEVFKSFISVIDTNIATSGVEVIPADVDDVVSFPHIIVHVPEMPKMKDTFDRYMRNGTIDIEIVAENVTAAIQLYDDLDSALFDNKSSLAVQNIEFGVSNPVPIEKGGLQAYSLIVPVSFIYKR